MEGILPILDLTMPYLYINRCDNTIGSFACVRYMTCGTGYTLNRNSGEVTTFFQYDYFL